MTQAAAKPKPAAPFEFTIKRDESQYAGIAAALSAALKERDRLERQVADLQAQVDQAAERPEDFLVAAGYALIPARLWDYMVDDQWLAVFEKAKLWAPFVGISPLFYEHVQEAHSLYEQVRAPGRTTVADDLRAGAER